MTISHFTILLARLFAVAAALYSVSSLVTNLTFYLNMEAFSFVGLAYSASIFLIGVLIWFMPYSFVKLLTGYQGELDSKAQAPSGEQIGNAIFVALALFLLFRVISDTAYWAHYYFNFENAVEYGAEIPLESKASMLATAVEALFVVVLLLGRNKILSLIHRFRAI